MNNEISYEKLEKEKIDTRPADKLPEFKDIEDRNKKLNKDADKRSVLDSIDRPIRPLVMELNRIGLRTSFSCCGYSYVGEEEPKSHSKWTQVAFYNTNPEVYKLLEDAIKNTLWSIHANESSSDNELFLVFRYEPICWNKCDNLSEAIHDYELKLHAIAMLTIALRKIPTASDQSVLRDGNETRKRFYGEEWMIEPKQPVTIIWKKVEKPK
jgi:hypothetical protein